MTQLPLAMVLQLAAASVPQVGGQPQVHPSTIAAFAQAESGLKPYAIGDNTDRRSYFPASAEEASAIARRLLAQGHSIDAGLMQVNSTNFAFTGLTPETAFDPAQSIRAGAMIMVEAYARCGAGGMGVDPLRCMASIYNTGRPTAGERNGYVDRVWKAADTIVPAIREAVPATPAPVAAPREVPEPHSCGPPPPSWDGWAANSHKRCLSKARTQKEEVQDHEDKQ